MAKSKELKRCKILLEQNVLAMDRIEAIVMVKNTLLELIDDAIK